MMPQFTPKRFFSALLAISFLLSAPAALAQGQKGMLQGNVKTDYVKPSAGPSLNRDQIRNQGDPFGDTSSPAEQFDAPDNAFQQDTPTMAPPPPPFNLQADDGQMGQQDVPMVQDAPLPPANMGNQGVMRPPVNPNDPDSSQQMQLQWDEWHKRVAESIFVRFDAYAQKAFAVSRPLACQAAYTVTRDRQITNVRVLQKSPNVVFNTMLLLVLKSMNGNPILEFPPGSRRMSVEKSGTFSRNCGVQGFKFTTGDQETIKQQQMRQQQMQMQQNPMMNQMMQQHR